MAWLGWLRIPLEALGVALAGYAAFLIALLLTMAGIGPALGLLAGYAALAIALVATRGRLDLSARAHFDCALLSLVPALLLTAAAVHERWPLRGPRADAHGWGLSGGEPNLALWSWIHGLAWLALAAVWSRLARGRVSATAPSGP